MAIIEHMFCFVNKNRTLVCVSLGCLFSKSNKNSVFFAKGSYDKKVGLRIKELERICGIEHGNNQRTSNNYKSSKSQEELAADLGISIPTLQNYKQLTSMIPELDDLVIFRELLLLRSIDQFMKDKQKKINRLLCKKPERIMREIN